MSPVRTFTVEFNLGGNLTAKYDPLRKKIDELTGATHTVTIDADVSDATKAVEQGIGGAADKAGKSLEKTGKAAENVGAAAKRGAQTGISELSALGAAVTTKTIGPLAEYQRLWGSSTQAVRAFGGMTKVALSGISSEFQKQRELAQFWGASGYINRGIDSLKNGMGSFLQSGGKNFTDWLKNSTAGLEQHRLALVASSAALVGFGVMAAMKANQSTHIAESIYSRMGNRFKGKDMDALKKWVGEGNNLDYSAGSGARLSMIDYLTSRTSIRGDKAKAAVDALEKYYFANQEYLAKKGYGSAEDLMQTATRAKIGRYEAQTLDDIFGKGFSKKSQSQRIKLIQKQAAGIDMGQAESDRPEVVLTTRLNKLTTAIGKVTLGPLNIILRVILLISTALGKIPGGGAIAGWVIVLTAMAAIGLTVLSMLGGMITNITVLTTALKLNTAASYAASIASKLLGMSIATAEMMTGIGALLVLAGILVAVAYKTGYLQKAWDYLLKTWKSLSKEFKNNPLGALGHIGAIALKFSPIGLLGGLASRSPEEMLTEIQKHLSILSKLSQGTAPYASKAHEVLKKILGVFEWLYSLLQGFWSWIKSALPGAAKEDYRKQLSKAMNATGLTYAGNGQYNLNLGGGSYKPVPESMLATGDNYDFQGVGAARAKKIAKLAKAYDEAPSFATGIAQAVKEGLSGLGDIVGKAIKESLPDFSGLTKALEGLLKPLQDLQAAIDKFTGASEENKQYGIFTSPSTGETYRRSGNQWAKFVNGDYSTVDSSTVPKDVVQQSPIGTTVKRPGLVHISKPGEEVVSAARVEHGPGAVAKAIDMLNNVVSTSSGRGGGFGPTAIYVTNDINLPGMKISNDVDVEKLLAQLDKRIKTKSVEAVKDALGQRRT